MWWTFLIEKTHQHIVTKTLAPVLFPLLFPSLSPNLSLSLLFYYFGEDDSFFFFFLHRLFLILLEAVVAFGPPLLFSGDWSLISGFLISQAYGFCFSFFFICLTNPNLIVFFSLNCYE